MNDSLFATRYSLLSARCSLLSARCSLFAALFLVSCASPHMPQRQFTDVIPKGARRVAVIGDQQRTGWMEFWKETNTQHADVVKTVMSARPDVMVLLGDQVFWGSSKRDWMFFDTIMAPVHNAGISVFPLYGNHEYMGCGDVGTRNMQVRFSAARTTWYRFDVDSVAYLMLNSNWKSIGSDSAALQKKWFEEELRKADADVTIRAVVVSSHHPPFTNSTVVTDDVVTRDELVPLFMNSAKGRLWLSGHCHALERIRRGDKLFVVSGGGGGPRQRLHVGEYARYADEQSTSPFRPLHGLILERRGDSIDIEVDSLVDTNNR